MDNRSALESATPSAAASAAVTASYDMILLKSSVNLSSRGVLISRKITCEFRGVGFRVEG